MAPVQPQRQHPQTEEGRVQAEEQEPDTRRTVEQQGTPPRGSPRSEPQNFDLTTEKKGLINVGNEDEPIYVKHNQLTKEEINEFSEKYGLNEKGRKMIKDNLGSVSHDLIQIATKINLPIELTSKLSEHFPDTDDTKTACFVYMSFLVAQLNKAEEDEIKSLEALVIEVSEVIFTKESIDWTEKVFELMTRRKEFSVDVVEVIYKKVMGSDMDIGAIFMFEEQPPLEPIPKEAKEQAEVRQNDNTPTPNNNNQVINESPRIPRSSKTPSPQQTPQPNAKQRPQTSRVFNYKKEQRANLSSFMNESDDNHFIINENPIFIIHVTLTLDVINNKPTMPLWKYNTVRHNYTNYNLPHFSRSL
jgi:hypothetical protein